MTSRPRAANGKTGRDTAAMSKFSKGISWREHRLADELLVGGEPYRANLVARKGTGVQGFRMTLVFLPLGAGEEAQLDLPNAGTTADVHRAVRELREDPDRLVALFHEAQSAGAGQGG
jgi:hypothetical protein